MINVSAIFFYSGHKTDISVCPAKREIAIKMQCMQLVNNNNNNNLSQQTLIRMLPSSYPRATLFEPFNIAILHTLSRPQLRVLSRRYVLACQMRTVPTIHKKCFSYNSSLCNCVACKVQIISLAGNTIIIGNASANSKSNTTFCRLL